MAFIPRTFEEIRDDMIAFVRMQTDLTDFEVGSVIRTLIEASALEDDEQYFQMVQLLDAFRLSTASGQDLDERVAEFGLVRLQPEPATGEVVITDGALVQSPLTIDHLVPVTILQLDDTSDFPTSGFPITVRVGEGTIFVEDISVTANNTSTGQLTLAAPLVNDHFTNERVAVVSGVNKPLSPGIRVQVPAGEGEEPIVFVTVESGTLVAGNFESTPIQARAELPGTTGNIGANKINEFASGPPFDGAGADNNKNFAGGRDTETDAELRNRARAQIQSLSRGTILALQQAVLGVEDPVTGQRVTTANILESFVTNEVTVYIDDGTGFEPDQVDLPRDTLALPAGIGALTLQVVDASDFPEEGSVIVSPNDLTRTEILRYVSVNHATNTLTLATVTAQSHLAGEECSLVDVVEDAAESGANFFDTSNWPIVRSSFRLWVADVTGVYFKVEGVDYMINRGTGQIEFIGPGVAAGAVVALHYSYYAALIHQVQKVIDGDPNDPTTYPGYRAAGIRVFVETPIIRRITVRLSITAESGFQEEDLTSVVQESIEAYINSLGIGSDVIKAEIIRRAMSVTGVLDCIVTLPTNNVIILENELPRPNDSDGTSLVTVN